MELCYEMQLLRGFLYQLGIDFRDASDALMCRTHFEYAGHHISVIFGPGSHGYRYGLLEAMIDGKEPKGGLDATRCMLLMKKLHDAKFEQRENNRSAEPAD